MNPLVELLETISEGQRSFKPEGSNDSDMENFQPVAKMIIHANEEHLLDNCFIHRESRTGNRWYDSVSVAGLSYRGEQFLAAAQDQPNSDTSITDSLILQPNIAGIGVDLKALAKYIKERFKPNV